MLLRWRADEERPTHPGFANRAYPGMSLETVRIVTTRSDGEQPLTFSHLQLAHDS